MDDGLYGVRYRYFECQNIKTFCKIPMQTILGTVSPSGGGVGHCVDPHLPKKFVCPPMSPTVLTQRCRFYNFYAVFGHFAELVSPTSQTHLENLLGIIYLVQSQNFPKN